MLWFISLLILSLAFYRLITYYLKSKKYYRATGIITGNEKRKVEDALMGDKFFYAAVVEFTDKEGIVQKMVFGEDNAGRPMYKPGDKVSLLVHPDDSSKFLEHDFINGYLIPVIWIIIGLAVILIPTLYPETFK